MGYAFISYSTKNQSDADALKQLFTKKGIRTWMAPNDIPIGSKYAQVINHAIKECACFVLLLTDAAQSSPWVAKEVERAVNYGKTILPIKLENLVLNEEFEFYISTDQIVAVQKIDEDAEELKKILIGVTAFTGLETSGLSSQPMPVPEPVPQHDEETEDIEAKSEQSKQWEQLENERAEAKRKTRQGIANILMPGIFAIIHLIGGLIGQMKAKEKMERIEKPNGNARAPLSRAQKRIRVGVVLIATAVFLLFLGFALAFFEDDIGLALVLLSFLPCLVGIVILIIGSIGRAKEKRQNIGTGQAECFGSDFLSKAKKRMKLGIILNGVSTFLLLLGLGFGFGNMDVGAPMIVISLLPWLAGTLLLIWGIIGQVKVARQIGNTEQ